MQNTRQLQNPNISILSDEIIVEIFLTLPVKTLVLLKCVCKRWCTLISNPWFINLHIKKLSSDPDDHSVILVDTRDRRGLIPARNPSCWVKLVEPFLGQDCYVVGTINGLVCLRNDVGRMICLLNPSIKKFKLIPPMHRATEQYFISMGFGYDPSSDDYKVVRIVNYGVRGVNIEVYSARFESWREFKTDVVLTVERHCDAIVEGFTYWVIRSGKLWRKRTLASFDLRSEVFSEMELPEVLLAEPEDFRVVNYHGSLALVASRSHCEFKKCFEVWMNGGGEGDLWQKKFTFSLGFDFSVDWYFTDGYVVVQNAPNMPFLFNLRTKQIRVVGLPFMRSVFTYTESLVWIKSFKPPPLWIEGKTR